MMPSNPVTATSPGTVRPACCSAAMTPIAVWSLAQTSARGTRPAAMIRSATRRPQGVLCLLRNDPGRPWTATEAAEIQPLAADIGRGFDHARMYQAEEELVEKLRAVDRARASFLASASHDVQTPLTSIQGYVEML